MLHLQKNIYFLVGYFRYYTLLSCQYLHDLHSAYSGNLQIDKRPEMRTCGLMVGVIRLG